MVQILLKSASFVFLIFLGYILKRVKFFGPRDYGIVMKIVLNITLPMAVITSFASYRPDYTLLLAVLVGFGLNWVLLGFAVVLSRGKKRASRAVWLNSVPGYNIGAFALPFVQSFLPPAGVVACCLFDAGSAIMCTGGTYALTSGMLGESKGLSLREIGKRLLSSRPFLTYVTMLVLTLLGVTIPAGIVSFISPMASANAFLAMFMVGMMFDLKLDREILRDVAGMVALRLAAAVATALGCYFLLPLPLEIRQAMCITVFAPVSVASTAFAERAGGDPGEAACVNSLCILISIVCMVTLLAVFGIL